MRRLVIYGLCLGAAVAVVLVGLDLLVETDQEQIDGVLARAREAASAADSAQLASLLDLEGEGFEVLAGRYRERFSAEDLEALDLAVAEGADWLGGAGLTFESVTVTVTGDRAHAYFRAVVSRPDGEEVVPVDLTLHRAGETWRITRLRALGDDRAARR